MPDLSAVIAANRFGQGAAPGELSLVSNDPRGWLLAQLAPQPLPPQLAGLPGSAQSAQRFAELKAVRRADKTGTLPDPAEEKAKAEMRALYTTEAAARTRLAVETQTPFYERLVQFWSNHFAVSTARFEVAHLAGSFEREAIRPHVAGRFSQMLLAAMRHPAMLAYLDNATSIGPDSQAGLRQKRGLNENLAREMMELHTLGVDGGYSQDDVQQLARVLTGWTIGNEKDGLTGQFLYQPRFHEPGPKAFLQVTIPESGETEALRAVDILTHHPATARFVATKLARHFIADDPPPAAVEALAKAFRESGGDLALVCKTLVERPEPWKMPLSKMKTSNDYVVSTLRLLAGPELDDNAILRPLNLLSQPPFGAPSPAGWPDRAEAWMGPEVLMRRIEWARDLAKKLHRIDLLELATEGLGPLMDGPLHQALMNATDAAEATLLLLSCPQFQRR